MHLIDEEQIESQPDKGGKMKLSYNWNRCLCLLTIMAAMIFATDAGAWIKKEMTKSFSVSPGGLLSLDTDLGSVEVQTGDNNAIEVEILLKADTRDDDKAEEIFEKFEVDYEQDGDEVFIIGDLEKKENNWRFWEKNRNKLRIKFVITIPEEFDIALETSGGSISVADLNGKVNARTSGGSLEFDNIKGSVHGKTSGGSISLSSCTGFADVRTSGGSISIGRVGGEVVAHTSGGSINIDEVMGTIDASTSGGSVNARIARQPKDDCRLTTSGGSVTVYLDPDLNFDVDAKTSAGHVETDFPVTVRGKISKSSLRAQINDGGPELYLRTSGGNIKLYEL